MVLSSLCFRLLLVVAALCTSRALIPPLPTAFPQNLVVTLPQHITQASPDPRNCVVNGISNMVLKKGHASGFSVQMMDSDNQPIFQGGWNLTASPHHFADTFHANHYDLQNGTFFVFIILWWDYDIMADDSISLDVLVEGIHIAGSPFQVAVERDEKVPFEKAPQENPCDELVVVSGANSDMFDRLENLVGSVHFWQKERSRIYLYGFDLLEEDVEEIKTWKYVKYRSFPCENYPEHVCRMGERCSYAFKAIVLAELLEKHQCVIWLDAGIEVRFPLDEITDAISRNGQFFVTNGWPFPNKFAYPASLAFFGKQASDFNTPDSRVYLEAMGGIQGYRRHAVGHLLNFKAIHFVILGTLFELRIRYQDILPKLLNCSLTEECIAPEGANKENFRQDQTALNVILINHPLYDSNPPILQPYTSKRYWSVAPMDTEKLSEDETQVSDRNITLFLRRGFTPKAYFLHVLQRKKEPSVERDL